MKNKFRSKKSFILLISLAFVLLVGVSGTIAYLVATSGPVVNIFTSSGVPITVTDKVENNIKENLVITNNGNVSAYIRVALVANWVDASDNIVAPVSLSSITASYFGDNWVKNGNYFYYKLPVAAGNTVPNTFIFDATSLTKPDGADHLEMTILAQAVQSDGYAADGTTKAVVDAWGVDPSTLGTNQ